MKTGRLLQPNMFFYFGGIIKCLIHVENKGVDALAVVERLIDFNLGLLLKTPCLKPNWVEGKMKFSKEKRRERFSRIFSNILLRTSRREMV